MILVTHIVIALASILFTTVTFFAPSKTKLQASCGLVALTLISGTYLVVSTHSAILSSCTTGLMYLAGVSVGLVAAHRKLAREHL